MEVSSCTVIGFHSWFQSQTKGCLSAVGQHGYGTMQKNIYNVLFEMRLLGLQGSITSYFLMRGASSPFCKLPLLWASFLYPFHILIIIIINKLYTVNKRIFSIGQNTRQPQRMWGFCEGGESLPAALALCDLYTVNFPSFARLLLVLFDPFIVFLFTCILKYQSECWGAWDGEQRTFFAFQRTAAHFVS